MDDSTVAAVLALVEQYQWPVFPCNDRRKPMTTHGFKDATRNVEAIKAWAAKHKDCLWGVPTGAATHLLVLDVDMKDGKDGEAALAELTAKHGKLPETAEVLTPSGGRHIYFAQPEGICTQSTAGKLGKGLDVRGDGGYVCIPPSRVNGRSYEWEGSSDPSDVGFAPLPAWLLELVRDDAPEQERPHSPGDPSKLQTALAAIVTGSPLHDSLRDAAAILVAQGLRFEDAVALLETAMHASKAPRDERFAERFAEIPKLVDSAIRKYRAQGDADTNRSPGGELEYEFADELDENSDRADELVEHMLTRGAMGVIYGDSNCGKTFLAIDIACAIARAILWMGRHVEPGMIVYLASESPASVRLRLRAYQKHHGVKVPNFCIVRSPINLYAEDDDPQRIVNLVRQREAERGRKCELIIGDTLSRLAAGANENSGEDMSIVVRHVDRIRHECGVHFLLIHHTGKNALLGMRGWSGMRAATDTEIEITADPDTGAHAAEITKQRDIPGKGDRIGFRLQVVEMGIGKWGKPITSCVVVSADTPPKTTKAKRPSEIAGAIVEFLTARGAGIKKGELVDHFEGRYTSGAVYRELKKMAGAGTVTEIVGIVALVPKMVPKT